VERSEREVSAADPERSMRRVRRAARRKPAECSFPRAAADVLAASETERQRSVTEERTKGKRRATSKQAERPLLTAFDNALLTRSLLFVGATMFLRAEQKAKSVIQ
jgi:hypothetical protein